MNQYLMGIYIHIIIISLGTYLLEHYIWKLWNSIKIVDVKFIKK